jgi:2,3-diaminopropionate biosynthesis protein SbnA
MILNNILDNIGGTPIVSIPFNELPKLNVFAKLEFCNPTGSVKDRAASYILKKCLEEKIIDKDTTIIESSSGNFAVSLSAYCKRYGLQFIGVIDPNILPINEMLIKAFGGQIEKVDVPDQNGGYLLTRIDRINELRNSLDNCYWVNQYGNKFNSLAYYDSLGGEICNEFIDELDYVFLGISSGGTISGLSRKLKERFPGVKVIAVDVHGSIIFGGAPSKRHIPGIGSSMVPSILKEALIDDYVLVSEQKTIQSCHTLLQEHTIFAGGSSGSVYAGIKSYFSSHKIDSAQNVLCIFPDRGERYSTTIYNEQWVKYYAEQFKSLSTPA